MRMIARSAAAVAIVFASIAVLFVGPASAHNSEDSYVYLDVGQTSLSGRIDYPFGDLRKALGFDLDIDASPAAWEDELLGRYDDLTAYADEHLDIQDYTLNFGELEFLFEEDQAQEINYVILPYTATVGGEVPQQLDITFNPFVEEVPDRNVLVIVQNNWQAGLYDNGEGKQSEFVTIYNQENQSQTVDLGTSSWWKNFSTSVQLGLDHIRTGPDHILFVFVLLLPSVLVFSDRAQWEPSDGFGSSLWRILKIATMFTIAHSITFTLAGLGILPLPSAKITESVIALSIAAAALHNLRPIFPNREWLIAFSFGLFHGMGFASLVSGLEVSKSTQLISLFGRNVGIEIGQGFVILVCFGLLYLLRNTVAYRWVMMIGSGVLTLVALLWMYERILERDVGVNGIVEKFTRFPRSVVAIAALTVVAAGFQMYERKNSRLVDTVDLPTLENSDDDDRELVGV